MAKAKQEKFTVTDKRANYGADLIALGGKKVSTKTPKISAVPLGSKVLVWRVPEEEGIIAIADSAKEKPLDCVVLAVSTTGLNEYDSQALALLQQGDKVLIRKNSGTEIKIEGVEVTVLHVQDILLKL